MPERDPLHGAWQPPARGAVPHVLPGACAWGSELLQPRSNGEEGEPTAQAHVRGPEHQTECSNSVGKMNRPDQRRKLAGSAVATKGVCIAAGHHPGANDGTDPAALFVRSRLFHYSPKRDAAECTHRRTARGLAKTHRIEGLGVLLHMRYVRRQPWHEERVLLNAVGAKFVLVAWAVIRDGNPV